MGRELTNPLHIAGLFRAALLLGRPVRDAAGEVEVLDLIEDSPRALRRQLVSARPFTGACSLELPTGVARWVASLEWPGIPTAVGYEPRSTAPGIFEVALDQSELPTLFAAAGAIDMSFIRENRSHILAFGGASVDRVDGWLQRAIARDSSGMRAHLSISRFGDRSWFWGGAATILNDDMSLDLVAEFGTTLPKRQVSEFWSTLWTLGHPRWQALERRSDALGAPHLMLDYVRTPPFERADLDLAEEEAEVAPAYRVFADLWDVAGERKGSPALVAAGCDPKRRTFVCRDGGHAWFVIASHFPPASSANRTMDKTWVLPLGLHREAPPLARLAAALDERGASSVGFFVPSELRTPAITRAMRWTLVPNEALTYDTLRRR